MNSFQVKKLFDSLQPCRAYLFLVEPPQNIKNITKEELTCFIRSIKMTDKTMTVEFMCDEENKLWNFFINSGKFKLSWLDRKGNIVNSLDINFGIKNIYIKELRHDADAMVTAVALMEYFR